MNGKIGHFYTSVDRLIVDEPVKLKSIVITPDAGSIGDVTLYNGRDTSGEILGTFYGYAYMTIPINFGDGLPCDRGIYVDVGSDVTGVLVIWEYID